MNKEFEKLLSPFYIGKLRIKNRLTVAPMGDGYLSLLGPRGEFSWQGMEHCIERAKGGFGLFISGCILYPDNKVELIDPISSSVDNPDLFIKQGILLNERCSYYDMKIFQQLTMGLGRNWGMASCSENPCFDDPDQMTAVLSHDDIKRKIDCVVSSAKLMQDAGFAGVEIHALHWGYLLDNFAMSITNRRTDEYGGCLENRMRVCKEIVEGIKQTCGSDYPVSMRLGLKSYIKGFNIPSLDGSDEAGRTLEEGIKIAQMLEGYGYDVLNVDAGMYDSFYYGCPPIYMPNGHAIPLAEECKKAVRIPVICGSKMNDPYMCEQGLRDGKFDAVAIGRPSLADPDFAKKIEMGTPERIRPCIGCLTGCMGKSREGAVMTCAVNPKAYLEDFYGPERRVNGGKVLVVGGGIAGMEAACTAARRGFEVSLYEENAFLGGVIALSAKQYHKQQLGALVAWYKRELEALGVNVNCGTKLTDAEICAMSPYAVVLALGAKSVIPSVPGSERGISVTDMLKNDSAVGENVVIVGGGLTGCETAIDLASKGKRVTIIETAPRLMDNSTHVPIMVSQMLLDLIDKYKIRVKTNCTLSKVINDGVIVNNMCSETVHADTVIYAAGVKPAESDLERKLSGCGFAVYTAGSFSEPGNIYHAIHSGYEIARNL